MPSLLFTDVEVNKSWKCGSCKRLMYAIDARGYPCFGAPVPMYIDQQYAEICSVCFEMHRALDKADPNYWVNLPKNKFAVIRPDPFHQHC